MAENLPPNSAIQFRNLGIQQHKLKKLDAAIACYQQSLAINPMDADCHYALGCALFESRRAGRAIGSFRQAIAIRSDFFQAYNELGNAEKEMGNLSEAVACFAKLTELMPSLPQAHYNLGKAQQDAGLLPESIASLRKAVELNPGYYEASGNLLFTLNYSPDTTPGSMRAELRRGNQIHARPLQGLIPKHTNNRDPHRRLKIGYVSPDFRNHPVGRFIRSLLECHDTKSVEIFLYAEVASPDEMTRQMQQHCAGWRSTVGANDADVAVMVLADRIDILVDLALHTHGNRLLVFARKPAPVQVSFAGYPGSTGLETIDYRLTDPYLDPPGFFDSLSSEQSVRLPDTFWCDHLVGQDPPVNNLPATTNGFVTFGSLNSFLKINDALLELWARVLRSVPNSKLMMLAPPPGPCVQRTIDKFIDLGINPNRIILRSRQVRLHYLRAYNQIDIGLDTWPYGGHSTSFDALWMGVPLVTLVGSTVVGRAGLSQLTNLGMTDLIAYDQNQYVKIATDLANDLPRLAELRRTLRERMRKSPLTDGPKFARGIEAAYRMMWKKWCEPDRTDMVRL